MAEVLKKFGRYFLLDQVAQGGMAEIYRARYATTDGPGRLFVVKKIQAGFGENSEFVQMFKSEIKVTMGLSHPNIVHVNDYGTEANQPFIAMEFVDGRNIRQILSRFNERKKHVPIEVTCMIIEQSALGLNYAHAFADKITGESLDIVHRDISPQNVIVSYDGSVKIIDFGIAKATVNLDATRAGVIKGKPSYLSPEQITGEVLDGRCDLFALGIVFWELLVGKKLFSGESDLAVLKMIESCQSHIKPPSHFNPAVPPELDQIVLKALSKSRQKRFQTGDELHRAIARFLQIYKPAYSQSEFSHFLKDEFKEVIVADKRELQRLNQKAEDLLISTQTRVFAEREKQKTMVGIETGKSQFGEVPPENTPGTKTEHDPRLAALPVLPAQSIGSVKSVEVDYEGTIASAQVVRANRNLGASVNSTVPGLGGSSRSKGAGLNSSNTGQFSVRRATNTDFVKQLGASSKKRGFLFVAASVALVFFFTYDQPLFKNLLKKYTGNTAMRAESASVVLMGSGSGVSIEMNGQNIGSELPLRLNSLPVGVPLSFLIQGSEGRFEQEVILGSGETRDILIQWTNAVKPLEATGGAVSSASLESLGGSSALGTAQLILNITPTGPGTRVLLNGKSLNASRPTVRVPVKEPLELLIERDGYRSYKGEFFIDSGEVNAAGEVVKEVVLDSFQFGFLTIRSTPSATVVISQGNRLVSVGRAPAEEVITPVENLKLSIGTYNVKLINPLLNMEKTKTITIEDGKVFTIDEHLDLKN